MRKLIVIFILFITFILNSNECLIWTNFDTKQKTEKITFYADRNLNKIGFKINGNYFLFETTEWDLMEKNKKEYYECYYYHDGAAGFESFDYTSFFCYKINPAYYIFEFNDQKIYIKIKEL